MRANGDEIANICHQKVSGGSFPSTLDTSLDMKRSFQQISRLARPAPVFARPVLSRPLATVSSSVPLGNSTSLEIELDAAETTVVTPSSDMMGFELSADESSQATDATREDLGRPIYLDAQATTPTDPRVLDAMLPYMTNQYGNPHSKTHAYGWETEKAVDAGRKVGLSRVSSSPSLSLSDTTTATGD